MRAGALKYRLILLRPTATADEYGAEATEYEQTRIVHAERVKQSGARSEEVGEHFADYRVEFNIRDAHEIAENWRIRQVGGYLYTVTNIIPNIDRGMLTLVCVRVNE